MKDGKKSYFEKNVEFLLKGGIDIYEIVENIKDSELIEENLDFLVSQGADIGLLLKKLKSESILKRIDDFLQWGAQIAFIVMHLTPEEIIDNFETLLNYGAKRIDLLQNFTPEHIIKYFFDLRDHGISAGQLKSKLGILDIVTNLAFLRTRGVVIDNVWLSSEIEKMLKEAKPLGDTAEIIAKNLDTLQEYGIKVNANLLTEAFSIEYKQKDRLVGRLYVAILLKHGANPSLVLTKLVRLNSSVIIENLDIFMECGAEIEELLQNLPSASIITYINELKRWGAKIKDIVLRLTPNCVVEHRDKLIAYGAKPKHLMPKFLASEYNLDEILTRPLCHSRTKEK